MNLRNLRNFSKKNYLNSNYLDSIPFLNYIFPYFNVILAVWIFSLVYAGILRSEINDYLFLFSLLSFFIISLKIESKIGNFCILGPFTFTLLFKTIIPGIGIYLLNIGNKLLDITYIDQFNSIKFAFLIGTPFKLMGFWLIFRFFKPNQSKFLNKLTKVQSKALYKIGLLFLLFSVVKTLVFFFSGSGDRTLMDVDSVSSVSSISGIFTAFNNLSEIGFLLTPYILKKTKTNQKIIIYLTLIIIFLFTILTGSRSPLVHMLLFFFIGSIIFKTFNPKSIKRGSIIFLILISILLPAIDTYRNLSSFAENRSVFGRINNLVNQNLVTTSSKDNIPLVTGAALYGTMTDLFIYKDTPEVIDHAGFNNFSSILYIYLPKSFFPNTPSTYDGQKIAQEYLPNKLRSFASISFDTDLYRRFSWIGVSIGNFIWGLFYGFISLILFKNFYKKPSSFSLLSIFCLYSFYLQPQTVLNQFWVWLYNFPKFLIILYFICMSFNNRKIFGNSDRLDL